jgi:flagellar basal body-associated protein FliL
MNKIISIITGILSLVGVVFGVFLFGKKYAKKEIKAESLKNNLNAIKYANKIDESLDNVSGDELNKLVQDDWIRK